MNIFSVVQALHKTPELCSVFDYKAIQDYVEIISLVKPRISIHQASYQTSHPPTLPVNIHEFLNAAFGMSDTMGKLAWDKLCSFAWNTNFVSDEEKLAATIKHLHTLLKHGLSLGIGPYNLEPPTRVCIDPRCSLPLRSDPNVRRQPDLKEESRYPITVFTKDHGSLPSFAFSHYCHKCNTRYYPNYFIPNASKADSARVYYNSTPQFIQTSEHFYMAADLCDLFSTMMTTSATSATNCAYIYNEGLINTNTRAFLPVDWKASLKMTVHDVWSGFYLYALICDHKEQGTILRLDHNAETQTKRLEPALRARNLRIINEKQEAWNHACDRCCYIYEDEDGLFYPIRSTVTDGITIGRPTCSVHDCKERLRSVKDRYCPLHVHEGKMQICSVVACKVPVETGFQTCGNLEHRKVETYHSQRGKAMFQLKRRLERVKGLIQSIIPTNTTDIEQSDALFDDGPGNNGDDDEVVHENEMPGCNGKSAEGNRVPRAKFGRTWTHNEELCVASCGVILGRATFYGSEAPNGVASFWMKLFPTKLSLPFVLWHDNNCQIVSMLNADSPDSPRKGYFDNCALPVDVFHFKCKHKESDTDCGKFCNPYIWWQLRTEDGKWRFNSSAAEQANAWFGGFQSMVREMQVDRYEFFLDEIIKRRNRIVIKELKRHGHAPYFIPKSQLLG